MKAMLDRRAMFFFGKNWCDCSENAKAFVVFMVNFTLPEGMHFEYVPSAMASTESPEQSNPN